MKGKIFPETSLPDDSDYFFKKSWRYLSDPDQFVIIKKRLEKLSCSGTAFLLSSWEKRLIMEILIDVTLLESARKQEAKANVAKSEFLARMSYEITNSAERDYWNDRCSEQVRSFMRR
ncbi:MAG: hypothetical protein MZV63_46515 [Marinilabiliales bacterium]|nr:hypothetical protein [Marinilabiliales bacterium]